MASCYSPLQTTEHTAALLRLRQRLLDNEALPPYSPYTAPPTTYQITTSSSPPAYTTTTTAPATTTLTLTPTSTSPLSAPAYTPHPGYTLQIRPSKSSGIFRKPPSLKIYRGSGEWEGEELARVGYHKGGGMDILFADRHDGEGVRLMAMERTGWREEAYSFLSGSGARWWKKGREAKDRPGVDGVASRETGVERVVSRESNMERVVSQASMASQVSVSSLRSGVSGVEIGGRGGRRGSGASGKAKRGGGEMVLVDGYGERYAVLEMAEGGGRFEVLKEGFEGEMLDEIVVSGVAWGVRRGLGGTGYRREERRSGRGYDD